MVVIGIDPGLEITGYGIVSKILDTDKLKENRFRVLATGIISTSRKNLINERITKIFHEIAALINKYKPEILVLEEIYSHYKHPKTAILMGHARGAIFLAASLNNIPVKSFSATHLKKIIVGRGDASKQQVKKMIEYLLNIKNSISSYDITDALSLCLAYIYVNDKEAKLSSIYHR